MLGWLKMCNQNLWWSIACVYEFRLIILFENHRPFCAFPIKDIGTDTIGSHTISYLWLVWCLNLMQPMLGSWIAGVLIEALGAREMSVFIKSFASIETKLIINPFTLFTIYSSSFPATNNCSFQLCANFLILSAKYNIKALHRYDQVW